MAPLHYAAKFDPFLSLDCARMEGAGKEGIKFCHLATLERGEMDRLHIQVLSRPQDDFRLRRELGHTRGGGSNIETVNKVRLMMSPQSIPLSPDDVEARREERGRRRTQDILPSPRIHSPIHTSVTSSIHKGNEQESHREQNGFFCHQGLSNPAGAETA